MTSLPDLPGFFSASHAARITHHSSSSSNPDERERRTTHDPNPQEEFYKYWQELLLLRGGGEVEAESASPTSPSLVSRQQETESHDDAVSFPTTPITSSNDNMSTKTNGKTNTNGSLSTKSNGTSPTTPPKPKKHTLASLWFTLTLPVILWDASYCFLRPRSMFGGDLHYIWKPYSIYQNVDLVYGVRTYEEAARGEGGGFTNAQSLMNLLETGGNLCYLLGMNGFIGSPDLRMRWVLIGFLSAGLTLAKTVLYWAQEYYCNFCAIGHNDLKTLILFWVIPNGLWIVFPSFIVWTLGKDLVRWLDWAERKAMDVKGK